MKSIKKIVTTIFITILSLYLLVYIFLSMPFCQNVVKNMIENILSDKLHTEVKIGNIEFGLFNRVTLNNLVLFDQHRKVLLKSDLISGRIELSPLLQHEISLRTITMVDGKISLYKNTERGKMNYQFILDAFKSKEKNKPSKINLRINSIILRRIAINYDKNYIPYTSGKFNINHIHIPELNANISLKRILSDSIRIRVRDLSLSEKSGFELKHLSMDLQANKKTCIIRKLRIEMPKSIFTEDKIQLNYTWTNKGPRNCTARISVNKCKLSTHDVIAFVPQLKQLDETFLISSNIQLLQERIELKSLILKNVSKTFQLKTSATYIKNPKYQKCILHNLYIKVAPNYIQRIYSHIFPYQNASVPLYHIGVLSFSAKGSLNLTKKIYAKLGFQINSGLGTISCPELLWSNSKLYTPQKIYGKINLKDIYPAYHLGNIDFNASASCLFSGSKPQDIALSLLLNKVEWNSYAYQNIRLTGHYNQKRFAFNAISNDPNAEFELKGLLPRLDQIAPKFAFKLDVKNVAPISLKLPKNLSKIGNISGKLYANSNGFNLKNPDLSLKIRDFTYQIKGKEKYKTDSITARMWCNMGINHLYIRSDFLDVNATGNYSYHKFYQLIPNYFKNYYSSLLPSLDRILNQSSIGKWGGVSIHLKDSKFLNNVLGINIKSQNGGFIYGKVDNRNNIVQVEGSINDLMVGTQELENIKLYCRGKDEKMRVLLQGHKINYKNKLQASIEFNANHSFVDLEFRLKNGDKLKGVLSASSDLNTFIQDKTLCTKIRRSNFYINDTAWTVHPSMIVFKRGNLEFQNFGISKGQQFININGSLSSSPSDSIKIDLHDIDLGYILDMVNFHSVEFAGNISGHAYLTQSLSSPNLTYQISSHNFQFNETMLGELYAHGSWNENIGKININAHTAGLNNDRLDINGFVSIKDKGLDLRFNAYNTTIQFLKPYVGNIFSSFDGRTSGKLRLYGPFKQLDFEGKHQVQMDATIATTGCRYHFVTDSVIFRPGKFEFDNVTLVDKFGRKATASGEIRHNHLKDLSYRFQAKFKDFLVYEKSRTADLPFYATVPGTGSLYLNGRSGRFSADIDIYPEKGTEFVYIMDTPSGITSDRQLLTFTDHSIKDTLHTESSLPEPSTDVMLNINVNANENAALRLIMDEKTGDYILVHGNGNLRTYYYNKGKFSIFGTYTVADGIYKMVLQNIIRKDFVFSPRGTIIFTGDPKVAALNLKAIYTVNSVSLSDLNPKGNFSDNNIKVNCILNLNGLATAPRVSFDLDLPTVSEEEKRMVKYLINTEEGMNMQIIYLLGVGRFYTYDVTSGNSAAQNQSSLAIQSFLSNTLSSHLNNVLSNAIGVKNWSFGTNFSTGTSGWEDMEIEGLLNGRLLNNQLLINGNFGYRDKSSYSANNFIGDFDIQWLLNPAGTIRLKAYSETNDRYFTKSTLTTQGIGIMLKRDFNNLRELFRKQSKVNNR